MDYFQPEFYRFSEDSLILSQKVIDREQGIKSLLELGSGCGVIGIEIANNIASLKKLKLLEKQAEFLAFIEKNTQSFLRDNISYELIHSSFYDFASKEHKEKFDVIVGNLPYFIPTAGRLGPNYNRNMCRHWIEGSFNDVIKILDASLNDDGSAYLITAESLIKNIPGYQIHFLDQFNTARLILVNKAK
jgi:tRNA1(Val) A37 N6-methylase TrmN6